MMRQILSLSLLIVCTMATAQTTIPLPIRVQADPVQVTIVPEVISTAAAPLPAPIASAAAPLPMEAAPIAAPDCNRCGGDVLNLVHVKDGVTNTINVRQDLGPLRRFFVRRIAMQRVRRLRR